MSRAPDRRRPSIPDIAVDRGQPPSQGGCRSTPLGRLRRPSRVQILEDSEQLAGSSGGQAAEADRPVTPGNVRSDAVQNARRPSLKPKAPGNRRPSIPVNPAEHTSTTAIGQPCGQRRPSRVQLPPHLPSGSPSGPRMHRLSVASAADSAQSNGTVGTEADGADEKMGKVVSWKSDVGRGAASRRPSISRQQQGRPASRRPSLGNVLAVDSRQVSNISGASRASPSGSRRQSNAGLLSVGAQSAGRVNSARLSSKLLQAFDAGDLRSSEGADTLEDLMDAQRLTEADLEEHLKAPTITPGVALMTVTRLHLCYLRAQEELTLRSMAVTDEERHAREANVVAKALAKVPLLQGCSKELAYQISKQAGRSRVKDGEVLPMLDGGPLYIVESGSVKVTVGRGHPPTAMAGPGSVLNFAGFLSLYEVAAPYEPGTKQHVTQTDQNQSIFGKGSDAEGTQEVPYELGPEKGVPLNFPVPQLFKENSRKVGTAQPVKGTQSPGHNHLSDELRCFYNLCPYASMENMRVRRTGWLPVKIEGNATKDSQGSIIAAIDMNHMEEQVVTQLSAVFSEAASPDNPLRRQLDSQGPAARSKQKFYQNLERLKQTFHTILTRAAHLLPGVPPEALWALAEVSLHKVYVPGQRIVQEADPAPRGEDIILIDDGVAIVEKLIGVTNVKTKQVALGRLYAGAVIGDICLLGAGIPRAASVRAETEVTAVILPSISILTVLRRFPGMLANAEHHLKQIVAFLQLRLPPRSDVMMTSSLFASCDMAFVNEVAPSGERFVLACGSLLQEGLEERAAYVKDSAVYIVEHGRCLVEYTDEDGEKQLHHVLPGACFGTGEPIVVGEAEVKMHAVTVVTPFALALTLPKRTIVNAAARHYGQERLLASSTVTPESRKLGIAISSIEVFRSSTPTFLEELGKCIQTTSYMTGQTVCVHGCQDASQTFVLKSGKVCVEKDGKSLVELGAGSVFGELMMLGAVRRRTATIRAVTYCTLLELPRQGFMEAIDRFPEERQRFEELAMRFMTPGLTITWPIAENMPTRLVLLLNMKANRMICPADDPSFQDIIGSAILILQGEAAVIDPTLPEDEREVKYISAGECWNEQVLLGIENPRSEYIVPKTACEVQVLSPEVFERCCKEFKDEEALIQRSIHKYMATQAEIRYGANPNSTDLLQCSALFRGTSEEFGLTMRMTLDPMVYPPGSTIIEEGEEGQTMYIIVDGNAHADRAGLRRFHYTGGDVFGDAVMLGQLRHYQKTVVADTTCVCFAIGRRNFLEALNMHEDNYPYFEALSDTHLSGTTLKDLMHLALQSSVFVDCDEAFLKTFGKCGDSAYFAPGEEIITRGTPCSLGETPFYILIAGEAQVEGEHGMLMEVIKPGAIVGEGGALGLSKIRGATVRVMPNTPAWCIIIHGCAVQAAMQAYPDQTQVIAELFGKRQEKNGVLFRKRKKWVDEVALPALRSSFLFEDPAVDQAFLETLAAPLQETTFETGTTLVEVGEPADFMMVLTQGKASIEDKLGEVAGTFTKGATFGEVVLLELFDAHIATVRASIQCVVIKIKIEHFLYALDHWTSDAQAMVAMQARFATIIAQRREQVALGLPLRALPTHSLDEVCSRAVALQAQRLDVCPDGLLRPLPDSAPCGPSLCIIVKGKLTLEIDPDSDIAKAARSTLAKDIMNLNAGDVFVEGTAAERVACARAGPSTEVYRVRLCDLTIAVSSAPEADDWWVRFRLRANAFQKKMCDRLINTHAMISSFSPHQLDKAINDWKVQRHSSMHKAALTRKQRALCLHGEWQRLNKTGCWAEARGAENETKLMDPTRTNRPATAPARQRAAKDANGARFAAAGEAPDGRKSQLPARCHSAPPGGKAASPALRPVKRKMIGSRPNSGVNRVASLPGLSVCDGKVWKVYQAEGKVVAKVVSRPYSAIATRIQAPSGEPPAKDERRGSTSSSTF